MVAVARSLEEAISEKWLTAALGARAPGVEVTGVEVVDTLHGVGTKALIRVSYAGETALPDQFCIKAGYEPHNAHLLVSGTYMREARFFKEIATALPIVVPECFYADYDEATGQGVLILENLRSSGARFCAAVEPVSVDEAAGFVESLAALHAALGKGAVARRYAWLWDHQGKRGSARNEIYTSRLHDNLAGPRAEGLPSDVRDAERLLAAFDAFQTVAENVPGAELCLVHGDPHQGNLYRSADGRPGFFDWQTTRAGYWAIDVPYYICAALTVDDHRRSGRHLLGHYLDHFARVAGVPAAPSFDDAWLSYRMFLVYGYYLWAITREVVQPPEVIKAFVERLGHAVADLDSFGALGV